MGIIIVGTAIFCYGLAGLDNRSDFWFALLCSTTGLSIALRGVVELTAHFVTGNLEEKTQKSS